MDMDKLLVIKTTGFEPSKTLRLNIETVDLSRVLERLYLSQSFRMLYILCNVKVLYRVKQSISSMNIHGLSIRIHVTNELDERTVVLAW